MFWRDTELCWWWYRAPIETQAMMIEAFDEVMNDQQAVEDCNVWLLKQKQTQDWKTTKATADAVYALLLRGKNLLASDELVRGDARRASTIKPEKVEAGHRASTSSGSSAARSSPSMGEITVKKVDEGVAWGSVHWQYLEDMSKVTPYEGTPLKLQEDALHEAEHRRRARCWSRSKGPLKVGDELVVRIELRVDRDMEYVHLKDQRGSGTEPVNVLSHYKYQDGLAYYESDPRHGQPLLHRLPAQGHLRLRVLHPRRSFAGQYQTGVAAIQCMYAPEFNSHSESIPLEVK